MIQTQEFSQFIIAHQLQRGIRIIVPSLFRNKERATILQILLLTGAPCYLTKFRDSCRHATSRNSGTPVAIIRSPRQRMGDALNALRPQRLRTKAASSLLPHWLDGFRNAILAPLACC